MSDQDAVLHQFGYVLYQFDADQAARDDEAKRTAVNEFLEAHGIDPLRFIIGSPVSVRRYDDGELWVDTWQAIAASEDGGTLPCEYCPHCVRQERVKVRLVGVVPEFFDGPYGPVEGA